MIKKKKRISKENMKQGKFLHIFVCFQGLNTFSKLVGKFNCSENFLGCTLRHTSQAYICMPIWGISFHFFAVPLGPSQRDDRVLQGRVFAPGPPTCWAARNLCLAKGESMGLGQCTTDDVSLHHSEKEKSTSSYRVTWETIILGFSCFPHTILAKN